LANGKGKNSFLFSVVMLQSAEKQLLAGTAAATARRLIEL
jgi:hypothetical protein